MTGKPAAEDILSKKKSLPVVYAFEKARGPNVRRWRRSTPRRWSDEDAPSPRLAAGVGRAGYAQRMAEVYRDHALAELPSPDSGNAAHDGLRLLARYLVDRVYCQPAQAGPHKIRAAEVV